jgi:hypothetical protein
VFARIDTGAAASAVKSLQTQSALLNRWAYALAAQRGVSDFNSAPSWRTSVKALRIPRRVGASTVGASTVGASTVGASTVGAPTVSEFGPLTYQNDDVLLDRLGEERFAKIALFDSDSNRLIKTQNSGTLYAYEIVNFIDGKRTVGDIRDAVAAELGPIPLDTVSDYLDACEQAKLITW